MVNSPITSVLKLVLKALNLIGLSCIRFDSNNNLKSTPIRSTLLRVLDVSLMLLVCILTVMAYFLAAEGFTWITFISVLYLGGTLAKGVCWNLRRCKQNDTLLNIWTELLIIETQFKKYGVRIKTEFIKLKFILLVTLQMLIRIIHLIMILCDDGSNTLNIVNKIRFVVTIIMNFPFMIIIAEYLTYFSILRQYFLNLNSILALLSKERTNYSVVDPRINSIKAIYTNSCRLCDKIVEMMSYTLVIICWECFGVILIHGHNLVSKLYSGKITNVWFFNYRYSLIWMFEYMFVFLVITIPAHLVVKNVSNLRLYNNLIKFN